MSASRGSGAGNGVGVQPIPAGSRKMVQSLKEIVNCSEAEIYVALKDCNMDPNEAVNRLLSQDPFHEVKSKREKKKEGKDTTEPRSRGAINNTSRSGKSGADRYHGRGGSTPYNSSESAPLPGKLSYRKENGSTPYASSLPSMPALSGNNRSRVPSGHSSYGASAENKGPLYGSADSVPSSIQPTSGYQSAWVGAPGQVSMADIVKMGRPHNKPRNAPNPSYYSVQGWSTSALHHNSRFLADLASKDPDSRISSAHQVPINEEWPSMPSIEKPPNTRVVSVPEYTLDSEQHLEASGLPSDSIDRQSEAEEFQEEEEEDDDTIEDSGANDVGSDSLSSRKILEDDSRGASLFENDLYKDMGSYQHQAHDFHEVEEVGDSGSSVTKSLQQLSIENDDKGLPSEGYTPSVKIPDHLVQNTDCSHLSFGSFGSAMGAAYASDTATTVPVETDLEEPHGEADISSVGPVDTRNSEYYVEDSLRNASDGGLFHRSSASAGNYDPSSAPQPEELKPESAEVTHGNQYSFPSSSPGYTFEDAQRLNAAFSQTSSQMQNLVPFSDVMQSYTNALPSNLPPANVHPSREADLQYSPFPMTQSMPAKYANSVSSIGGSAISMSEALKTAGFSSTQPAPHTLSGTSVATGPPLPQHLVHPYSQPTLPLGPFANMIGYPFLPQSYTYLPSAFQQTFAGNSTYHQSLAAVLPQYKNNVSASSLSQSAAIPSGYGAFGNATTIQGNFAMNPPAAPSGTAINYDDVLSSQYKDNSHLVSLQQNENSAMWLHGPNSRTMSAVPASTYYNYQGQQTQQSSGFRQGQQPSQNYGAGALGYPNFYHSQAGVSLDQQQNPRDGSLGGSQGQQQPKQSQLWQNSY